MPTLFRKTTKGQTEIETRAHRLSPRLRGLLILVDGKRDDAALEALVPAPQQGQRLLAELLDQGFIEALAASADAAANAPLPAATTPPAGTPAAPREPDLAERRRNATRALTDLLGPAAESLAVRIERARSDEALRPLLMQAAQSVANLRGRDAAQAFAERFIPQ